MCRSVAQDRCQLLIAVRHSSRHLPSWIIMINYKEHPVQKIRTYSFRLLFPILFWRVLLVLFLCNPVGSGESLHRAVKRVFTEYCLLQTYRKPRSPARQFHAPLLRRPVPVRQERAFRCCREDIPALYSEPRQFFYNVVFLLAFECQAHNFELSLAVTETFFCESGLCQVWLHSPSLLSLSLNPIRHLFLKIFHEHEQNFRLSH